MRRTLELGHLNAIANHPMVRPWLGGQGPLDLTGIVENPDNFVFLTDDELGAYVLVRLQAGLYEVHTLSLPEGRGTGMLHAAKDVLSFMFTATDCLEIVTKIPEGNRRAGIWAAHMGFVERFTREQAFQLMDERVGVSYRSITYQEWVPTDARNDARGKVFHEQIHELVPDDHGDDPIHDQWVGATLQGCKEGNGGKALALYNRWAAVAGYEPARILQMNPFVVDIRSCVLSIGSSGLTVLKVREGRSPPSIEDLGELECPSALPSRQPAQA